MEDEPCWGVAAGVFGWALQVQSSPWGQEGTGLAARRLLRRGFTKKQLSGTGSVPALLLLGMTCPRQGVPAPCPGRVSAASTRRGYCGFSGLPVWRGTAWRCQPVLVDGGRGPPPPHAAAGLVQQPLPPLCRSSEVGMAEPSLTFPAEHESPPCSLTP